MVIEFKSGIEGCSADYQREAAGGWSVVAPHYKRIYDNHPRVGAIFREEMSKSYMLENDTIGTLNVERGRLVAQDLSASLVEKYAYDFSDSEALMDIQHRSDHIYGAHFQSILKNWYAQGAPLFELGPVMTEELRSLADSYEWIDDFIPQLISRLPFDFFYLKTSYDCDGYLEWNIEGAYIFKAVHNETPALCILLDDGFTLDPWYCEENNEGETRMCGGYHGVFLEFNNVWPDDSSRAKAGWLITVLDGLLRYLEATNKEIIDPTPAIRAAITSGKKSKVRKAINQMIGKRKIWIEPTLERKAREQGITGEKLTSGHVRRGHLHTYYTGAKLDADGLKIPTEKRKKVVKFVAPTWVGPRTITAEPREYGIRARR